MIVRSSCLGELSLNAVTSLTIVSMRSKEGPLETPRSHPVMPA